MASSAVRPRRRPVEEDDDVSSAFSSASSSFVSSTDGSSSHSEYCAEDKSASAARRRSSSRGTKATGGGKGAEASRKVPKFILATYDMLSCTDNHHGISFNEQGTMIELRDLDVLSSAILPRYFRHGQVASFTRQLNNYNFELKVSRTGVHQTFAHPFFVKDRYDLLPKIERRKAISARGLDQQHAREVKQLRQVVTERLAQLEALESQNQEMMNTNQLLQQENAALVAVLDRSLQQQARVQPPQEPVAAKATRRPMPNHPGVNAMAEPHAGSFVPLPTPVGAQNEAQPPMCLSPFKPAEVMEASPSMPYTTLPSPSGRRHSSDLSAASKPMLMMAAKQQSQRWAAYQMAAGDKAQTFVMASRDAQPPSAAAILGPPRHSFGDQWDFLNEGLDISQLKTPSIPTLRLAPLEDERPRNNSKRHHGLLSSSSSSNQHFY